MTRADAGPVQQGMERMRDGSMPRPHTLPQACRPLRPRELPGRRALNPNGWGSTRCLLQGEEAKAREMKCLSQPSGTARTPAAPVPLIFWALKIHLSMHHPPNKGEAAASPPAHTPGPAE